MEIKIGIVNAAREVSIDAQESVETIEQQLRESLAQLPQLRRDLGQRVPNPT
jgi:hypothetical protein